MSVYVRRYTLHVFGYLKKYFKLFTRNSRTIKNAGRLEFSSIESVFDFPELRSQNQFPIRVGFERQCWFHSLAVTSFTLTAWSYGRARDTATHYINLLCIFIVFIGMVSFDSDI